MVILTHETGMDAGWQIGEVCVKTGNPFFSIIVVCYNAGEELHKTVQSILEQTFTDYEIIVKDGGSVDDSLSRLPESERLRVFSAKDKGIYDAMNQAVSYVEGSYVLFLNCGDYFYDREVLAQMHRAMVQSDNASERGKNLQKSPDGTEKQLAIYYGNTFERKTGNVVNSNPNLDAFGCYRNVPCHQCCFYPAQWLKPQAIAVYGRKWAFNTEYKVRADYEHFLWCFFERKAETVYVPVTVCSYEGGGFSETVENKKRSKKEHKQITEVYMTCGMRFRYKAVMLLTLAPLRTKLAESKRFSAMYQKLKKMLYRG